MIVNMMRSRTYQKKIDNKTLILFWQFTIKTLSELDIVSNQNLSIEMFLLRLIHLREIKENKNLNNNFQNDKIIMSVDPTENIKEKISKPNKMINQIKSTSQTNKVEFENKLETNEKSLKKFEIRSFSDLIKICDDKKEIKLKYELENNVNLVKFEKLRIEISFNENLNKSFIKDLTSKLNNWTDERWIISLSKTKGEVSYKEKQKKIKEVEVERIINSKLFSDLKNKFSDIKLVDLRNVDEDKL